MTKSTLAAAAVLAAAACIAAPGPARAQAILNTERFQLADLSAGTHATVDANVSGAFGNTRYLNAGAAGIVGHLGDRHWPRVIAGGRFLADRERRLVDDHFVQLRYSYLFSARVQSFTFVQYQANRSLLLRSRWLAGGGIRATAAASAASAVHVGSGLMLEEERRREERLLADDAARLRTVRFANHAVATHRFESGARLVNIVYYQPSAAAPSNFRLLNDLRIDVPVTARVALTASVEWRHDSHPPAALARNDVGFRTGVSIDVR